MVETATSALPKLSVLKKASSFTPSAPAAVKVPTCTAKGLPSMLNRVSRSPEAPPSTTGSSALSRISVRGLTKTGLDSATKDGAPSSRAVVGGVVSTKTTAVRSSSMLPRLSTPRNCTVCDPWARENVDSNSAKAASVAASTRYSIRAKPAAAPAGASSDKKPTALTLERKISPDALLNSGEE